MELGICSWSVHQTREPDLRPVMERLGLRVVHLAIAPLAAMEAGERARAIREFAGSSLRISAGMINFAGEDYTTLRTIRVTGGLVPDATARERIEQALVCAAIARDLGLTLVSTHAGLIPPAADRAAFEKLQARIGGVADQFAAMGLTLLFETGQETAADLLAFLQALGRPNVGVNFDPANMLLYGKGDPVAAIGVLGARIKHVHAKDTKLHAPPPVDEAAWRGREIPLGQGDARLAEVVGALRRIGYAGPLVVEREAGGEREKDVREGIEFLKRVVA